MIIEELFVYYTSPSTLEIFFEEGAIWSLAVCVVSCLQLKFSLYTPARVSEYDAIAR